MPVPPALQRALALLLTIACLSFVLWTTFRRVDRVDHVTATDAVRAEIDASSPTGYTHGRRWLIVPEHHTPSYERIAETQHMLATGQWRLRQETNENAPTGRPVYSSSLYRWWLAGLAWFDHSLSGRPIGLSVERAAVWSEPLLQLILLFGGGALVARYHGLTSALGFGLGVVFLFPLAASFLPAVPHDRSLARLFAWASLLPLIAAWRAQPAAAVDHADRSRRRLFVAAGIAGGFGLWVDAPHQTWLLAGTVVGASLATFVTARSRERRAGLSPSPWRSWAWAGALTSTAAYLLEYAPAHLALRLEVNHPLYAIAWLGVGELLTWQESRVWRSSPKHWSRVLLLVAAAVAAASLPLALVLLRPAEWFSGGLFASRLTYLPNGIAAASFASWLGRDGWSGPLLAATAPLLLLIPALRLVTAGDAALARRRSMALLLGLVAVLLPIALTQLAWWSTLDLALLAIVVVWLTPGPAKTAAASQTPMVRLALVVLVVAPGLRQLLPASTSDQNFAFTRAEVEALIERAAAHWIADRGGPDGATVLLPPARTTRWTFHGGQLRGLGSAAWENRDGLAATIRIAAAQTGEEAQALLQERNVSFLVLPSWDADLREFARLALSDAQDAFITAVHQWSLPSWLRPLPYPMPVVPGLEGESIVVLQVTDETNRARALSRMLEFFLETERPELADAAGEALRRFPADANALIGLAQLQKARGDARGFQESTEALLAGLSAGFDRGLPWDRRVSLAIVLAQAERHDLAREQVQRLLERIEPDRILTLTTGALYRLQVLARAYGLSIEDPELRERARQLLPEPLQERIQP